MKSLENIRQIKEEAQQCLEDGSWIDIFPTLEIAMNYAKTCADVLRAIERRSGVLFN
jgi:hypothetical protein